MSAITGSRPTILLVDDQHAIRHMLSAGLKAQGFDVLTAGSAEKAMAFCAGYEGRIDLLLSDISLTPPELWPETPTSNGVPHGLAVVEQARRLRPSLKVVLFTGHSDQHLAKLGLKTDGFLLLRKPCNLSLLISTFRQLLNISATSTEPGP